MKFSGRWYVALLAAVSVFLIIACGGSSPSSASSPGQLATVNTNYLPVLPVAPIFIAEDKGFFKKHGIVNNYTTVDIYATLAVQSQGGVDVDIPGAGAALFNAINQGLHLKVVASRQQYNCTSDNLFVVRTDLWNKGIRSMGDLKGKKIAILSRGSTTEYWMDLLLDKAGMTEKDLTIVTLSYPDTVTALKTGAVDAAFLIEPLAYQDLLTGNVKRIISMGQVAPNMEQGQITMSDQFIQKDGGKTAANWMAAWLDAVRYYQDPKNKQDVINIIAKWTKVPTETVAGLYGTDQWPYMNPNGQLNVKDIEQNTGPWLIQHKYIDHMPASKTYYDQSVIQKALKEVGTVSANRDCSNVPPLQG